MSKEPNRNVYVGHRYVPKIFGEWDQSKDYEGLSIVTHQGNSYTSKKRVPVGIDILNEEFWVVTGNYNAQVENYRDEVRTLSDDVIDNALNININKEDINKNKDDISDLNNELSLKQNDLDDRGVNLKSIGFKLDGSDELEKINQAFSTYRHLMLPGDGVLGVSDTLIIPNGRSLIGMNENTRNVFGSRTPTIKYIGAENRKKSVVVVGSNDVGAEPTKDSSNIRFKNVYVDADEKAGFGVYGTYLVNETYIDNVVAENSLEYNFYLARGWYATIKNITSMNCKGNGIALGMPLEYQNGETVNWATPSPLELNNVKIDNIRSINSGRHYSIDNPGLYDPTDPAHRRKGYGIGAGIGNGFRLQNFLSERSGGVNLYVYTGSQPSKTIEKGYIENSALNSGLEPSSELPNMIIENTSTTGGTYNIRDIFMNYNSGGIYHVGVVRMVLLENIHQPRFLKSLDERISYELYQFVIKDNVYTDAGLINTNEALARDVLIDEITTRYSFTVNTTPIASGQKMVFFKSMGDEPYGGYTIHDEDGRTNSYGFPSSISSTEWTFDRIIRGGTEKITKSGGTGDLDGKLMIKIVSMPGTGR